MRLIFWHPHLTFTNTFVLKQVIVPYRRWRLQLIYLLRVDGKIRLSQHYFVFQLFGLWLSNIQAELTTSLSKVTRGFQGDRVYRKSWKDNQENKFLSI